MLPSKTRTHLKRCGGVFAVEVMVETAHGVGLVLLIHEIDIPPLPTKTLPTNEISQKIGK